MFGYEIGLHENKTCQEIMHLLDEVRKKDHKDNGALIVCILSHGYLNTVTGACSEDLGIDEIMILYSALTAVQACRGNPNFSYFRFVKDKKLSQLV